MTEVLNDYGSHCLGSKEEGYKKFETMFIETFQQLRTKKNYILNLMHLMINCGMPNLPFENYEIILEGLHERFLPNDNLLQAETTMK